MSLTDIDNLGDHQLISHYISEVRGCGLVLSYSDYYLISNWIEEAGGNVDLVLLVLSEILPPFYEAPQHRQKYKYALRYLNKKIQNSIRSLRTKNLED